MAALFLFDWSLCHFTTSCFLGLYGRATYPLPVVFLFMTPVFAAQAGLEPAYPTFAVLGVPFPPLRHF